MAIGNYLTGSSAELLSCRAAVYVSSATADCIGESELSPSRDGQSGPACRAGSKLVVPCLWFYKAGVSQQILHSENPMNVHICFAFDRYDHCFRDGQRNFCLRFAVFVPFLIPFWHLRPSPLHSLPAFSLVGLLRCRVFRFFLFDLQDVQVLSRSGPPSPGFSEMAKRVLCTECRF